MKTSIPFKILSIGEDGFHLIMKLKINGKSSTVVIDTGASKTVFDMERIQKFIHKDHFQKHDKLSVGLGDDKIKSEFTSVKKLSIGDLVIVNYSIVLMDLSHVNKSYESIGLKPIDGVLGSDILLQYKAVIDYDKKTISFKSKKVQI
jgi:hypothetical protein